MKIIEFIVFTFGNKLTKVIKICSIFYVIMLLGACSDNNNKKQVRNPGKYSYEIDTFYSGLKEKLLDLSGSSNIEEALCQGWTMEEDLNALSSVMEDDNLEIPVRSFHIFYDHHFMRNVRNGVESGRWEFNNRKKELDLFYDYGGAPDHYKIRAIAPDELILTDMDLDRRNILKYVSGANRYKNKMDDPFYVSNNQWRKPPPKKESDIALRQRTKAFFHFFVLFYRDAIAREADKISFYGFPSCITWYSGGIYHTQQKELKSKWFHCFYDQNQADKSYQLVGDIIGRKYTWPTANINWLKKNLAVLEQMETQMNAM